MHKDLNDMAQGIRFEVAFMDEATEFLSTLSLAVREKIYYNIGKVAGSIIDNDLFKKLDGSEDIWEFRTLYHEMQCRLFVFWEGTEK